MRIAIITAGSRGDVQPYVALGRGLAARGHAVTLATHAPFEGFVRRHGLGFRAIAGDPQAMLAGDAGLAWLESAANPVAFVRHFRTLMVPLLEPIFETVHAAVADAEAVIYAPLAFPALDFAEARGIPALMAGPVPLTATREFPFPISPDWLSLPGDLNWLSHQAVLHVASVGLMAPLNRWRRRLGMQVLPLGGLSLGRQAVMSAMYGFSPHVLPRPADWPAHASVTGFWFLDAQADWTPPPDLTAFLAAGEPPVYVGFGSMIGRDPVRLAHNVYEALRLAGRRGIVLSGWAGLGAGDVPDHVKVVHDVPHDWLFPRCAAVVHHGGAGTTAAGLRAGVPSVIAPYFADQPFWGRRVHALGVGPRPVPQQTLTAAGLGAAIQEAVSSEAMQARAAALGRLLRAEDGVTAACDAFERFVEHGRF